MKIPESAMDVLDMLADPGTLTLGESPAVQDDPLHWTSPKPYADRLREVRRKTGLSCGIVWGRARMRNQPVVLVVNDLRFLMGSIGVAETAALARCFRAAVDDCLPVVWIARGGGANLFEGTYSLAAVARILAARNTLAENSVPLLAVAADPLMAGCSICAMQADVVLALEGASVGFAGPKSIQMFSDSHGGEPLPAGFQTAAYALATGQVDGVIPAADMRDALVSLLATIAAPQPVSAPASTDAAGTAEGVDAWQLVQRARSDDRPATREVVAETFESFFELRGDRVSGDDPAILAGLARLVGQPVAIIAHDAMRTAEEKVRHNFAMPHPAGHRKALRVVRLAERLRLPIVTFVDTPGACPDVRSESEGQAGAMGQLLCELLAAKVPTVSVILGQGSSGAAMVLATVDHVLMTDSSHYAVVSPEAAAAIVWKDPARTVEAAAALHLSPADMRQMGLVDAVVPFDCSPRNLGQALRSAIAAGLAASSTGDKRIRLRD